MSSSDIHRGHRERLRRRFLETGIYGFQEHEILELLLFYALPRVNTNEISHRLIDKFGGIAAVLDADISELSAVKGLSESSAALIKFMRDLCLSYALSSHPSARFSSPSELEKYFSDYFNSVNSEICLILSISPNFELLTTHSYPSESLLSAEISGRSLAETALRNNMRRIVIGQYHPDKHPIPDENDYAITRIFAETLTPLGIEIYDHIICGDGKTFSMRKNGAFSFTPGASQNYE